MKTGEDFKQSASENNISEWTVHDCSICGYPCGYQFSGDDVYYDSGCWCVSYSDKRKKSWDDVASFYNMQSHPDIIKKFDEFWHFTSAKKTKGLLIMSILSSEQIGPIYITPVPYYSCNGCKYLMDHGVIGGCYHPSLYEKGNPLRVNDSIIWSERRPNPNKTTPRWCPELEKQKAQNEKPQKSGD
jgi:hypothetical protein